MAALSGKLPSMRSMYVAPPGWRLTGADYSQLELRMIRYIAKDEVLAQALESGDVYSADARDVFGLPADFDVKTLKPVARQSAKVVHLAFQYGAGLGEVHRTVLKTDRTIAFTTTKQVHEGLKKRYHRTVSYWTEEWEKASTNGYSETRILHRRLNYPATPKPTETANFPCQGTAGDVMTIAMLDLEERLRAYGTVRNGTHRDWPRAFININLHDALYVEHIEEIGQSVKNDIELAMGQEFEIEGQVVRLPVEVKTAQGWDNAG